MRSLASVFGILAVLLTAPLAFGAGKDSSQTHLQCETTTENSQLCLSGGADDGKKIASSQVAGATKSSGLLRAEELRGGALDLDNQFEFNTVLGAHTEAPGDLHLGSISEAQKANGKLRGVELVLQNSVLTSTSGKVSAAGAKK